MRLRILAFLLISSIFSAQTIAAVAQVATPAATSSQQGSTITLPAGKVIPLTLVSPIKSKSTKIGDTVRAQVAFPITVGSQIAIPAGTYVEGTVNSIDSKKTKTNAGGLQIHFTKLIYANGYSAPLDAVNTVSVLTPFAPPFTESVGVGSGIGMGMAVLPIPLLRLHAAMGQNPSAPTPAPLPGPPRAFVISLVLSLALFVGIFITMGILSHRHAGSTDVLLYDAGYQMQMATTVPVTLDVAQVNAAASMLPQ